MVAVGERKVSDRWERVVDTDWLNCECIAICIKAFLNAMTYIWICK